MFIRTQFHCLPSRARSRLRVFFHHQGGVAVILVALALPVLVGTMGLAAEASYWYLHTRAMQNAADAAAIAAATNASTGYKAEAKAVAANLGFQDQLGNITVTPTQTNNATGCPANQNCYTVTVSDKVPLLLSRAIGYTGNATVGNNPAQALSASAVATANKAYSYCILALANFPLIGPVVGITGAAIANLNGCNVISDSNAICALTNLNANVGDAVGANLGCGIVQHSNVPTVADPYAGLAANIPADPCGGVYHWEPILLGPPLPPSNQLSGSIPSGSYYICGDLQLTGDTTIGAPGSTILVIYNGRLDTNGHTLQTASGSGLTIVFTGSNILAHVQIPTGGGTLDIAAPTIGPWSGIAIYQDPKLAIAANVNLSSLGLSPAWKISGMVYLPYSVVTLAGAVNPATNGARCFGMVVGTFAVAVGSIFPNNNQCAAAGAALPLGGSRGTLVN